jgi:alpha-ketoglutarate-dependent taurine dioxygenase
MPGPKNNDAEFAGAGIVGRKARGVSRTELVTAEPLREDNDLPLLLRPVLKGVDLADWANANREMIERNLLRHGALLFRNFSVNSIEQFEQFAKVIFGELLEYKFRASPRSLVGNRIYTSTDYPPDQYIFPHNEHAYSPVFPLRICFYCVTPAARGGETVIGDTRKIGERILSEVKSAFAERGVLYVRNYGDGFGLSWETVFQTGDRAEVERYCHQHNILAEWKEGGRLRTLQRGPATLQHPQTGEHIWFNHATFFHVTTLPPSLREELLAEFAEEDLPNNTYYGDGTRIEEWTLEHLRSAYTNDLVAFPWQRGDVLLLDNMLTVHGRNPYEGRRQVVCAMADPRKIEVARL